MMSQITFSPIGVLETCYLEKFGVPRQSLMVSSARGVIRFKKEFSSPECFLHLDGFSHLWVIYVFHKAQNENHPGAWSPTIAPPRLEAPAKVGVFASRSPHRPNPIGLSVVKIEEVRKKADGEIEIEVSGVDILDGSPVLDIKPYLPYADGVPAALSGWAEGEIPRYSVEFTQDAELNADRLKIRKLIEETLALDPRPRSQRERNRIEDASSVGRRFAFRMREFDIHWEILPERRLRVIEIKELLTESQ
jgi:tRNA-Thr(GGU) m(6)t(6)A37 methyltransferase TsaA